MKRKGFTLIELLAVIIVLAIIALIATPIIFNVIENTKIKSIENSCYGIIDTIRTKYMEELLNSADGTVDLSGYVTDLILSGEQPIAGTWSIDNSSDSNERGIKIEGVKFASMKNYTCSNVDENGKITSKVTCKKDGIDEQEPTITAKKEIVEVNKGTNIKIKNYFNVKFGETSGNVTCEVENVNLLEVGEHTVKCIATGTNGKTAEATIKIIVNDIITLKDLILSEQLKGENQIWTTAWQESDPSGLYAQTVGSNKTYYFRGQPTNNYIKFAGLLFRILRVNEDGTIRIMLIDSIGDNSFNTTYDTYDKIYYTNSEIKTAVDNWFSANIKGNNANKVANGNYFCEQARVVSIASYTAGNATVETQNNYTPTFSCATDLNGKGIVSGKVGLIMYDETIYAGGWYNVKGLSYPYYLNNGNYYWTMSPAGFNGNSYTFAWRITRVGYTNHNLISNDYGTHPVLNLNANTLASGSGTETDPYAVK